MSDLMGALNSILWPEQGTGANTTLAAMTIKPGWAEVVGWFGQNEHPEAYTGPVVSETDTHITLSIQWEPMTFLKTSWKVRRP